MKKYTYQINPILLFIFIFTTLLVFRVDAKAAAKVYFSVEKFTIGQGYVVEPKELEVKDGEELSSVTERLLKQEGYTYKVNTTSYGWYLAGINNADTGDGYVPECIQNMSADAPKTEDILPASKKNGKHYPGLYEYSYTEFSGWMFYPNNKDMHVGAGGYHVQDGDVIRLRFTLYGIGADLDNGRGNSLSLPNLDAITKRMAVYNANKRACDAKGYASAYDKVKSIVTNMDSTSQQIEEAYSMLPSEEHMKQWGAELVAEEKATAEKMAAERKAAAEKDRVEKQKQALIKKYTPSKVSLSSVKKSGKNKVKITWKKVKSCTGYQIYMSTKKNSGYKKIKTLKGFKKVTLKKSKLKKKKTYYFKIRAYRKVGGKTYYGKYSNIRKLKIK